MSKRETRAKIKSIVAGGRDHGGNRVVFVFASSEEYIIYEIDHPDNNYRLRIFIDAESDDREEMFMNRFNRIRLKYIEAKSLIYKYHNREQMKNLVANTLFCAMSSDSDDGTRMFEELIRRMNNDENNIVLRRILYIFPSFLFCVASGFLAYLSTEAGEATRPYLEYAATIAVPSSLGAALSILTRMKSLRFEDLSTGWYPVFGFERVFIACVATATAFLFIKSGVIVPELMGDPWKLMPVLLVAAFSEAFIPSILGRLESRLDRNDPPSSAKPA